MDQNDKPNTFIGIVELTTSQERCKKIERLKQMAAQSHGASLTYTTPHTGVVVPMETGFRLSYAVSSLNSPLT